MKSSPEREALLVRVGIDSSCGGWNAPVNPDTLEFVYVPIPEEHPNKAIRPGYERSYQEFKPSCTSLGEEFPERLLDKFAHLDPDFEYLTYGDENKKGEQVRKLVEDDILAFYAGLRPLKSNSGSLVYAIIGFYVVDKVVPAAGLPPGDWHKNAHTRRFCKNDDVIVFGKVGLSGRLKRCVPIGEFRDGAYRVKKDLLHIWGGLSARNGYIQRSARLPHICNPTAFYEWLNKQDIALLTRNT